MLGFGPNGRERLQNGQNFLGSFRADRCCYVLGSSEQNEEKSKETIREGQKNDVLPSLYELTVVAHESQFPL